MDAHIYRKGKYIRTDRNISSTVIEVEGDLREYQIRLEEPQASIELPPTVWPEGAEL
jgi:hypothetical protein